MSSCLERLSVRQDEAAHTRAEKEMPRTYKCSFCGKEFLHSSGLMYVRNDGVILRFCSSKCRKASLELRRDPRKFKWTEIGAK